MNGQVRGTSVRQSPTGLRPRRWCDGHRQSHQWGTCRCVTFQELLVATGFVCSCHPFTDVTTCISDFCFMTKDNGYRTENVKLLMVLMTVLLRLVQGPHTLHISTPCLPLPAMTRGTLAHSWALPSLPFTSQSFSPQHTRVRVPLSSVPPAWVGSALLGLSTWVFPEAEPE